MVPKARSTIERKIRVQINLLWQKEWMSDPDWCRQTKYFFQKVDKMKTQSLLRYGKEATSRFIRFITGHAFLRKHNAYVRHGTNKGIPFDEVKCRMCGNSPEEPVHIIKECDAFCQERFNVFDCVEWFSDRNWSVDQMVQFLGKIRIRNLENEEDEAE